MKQILIIDDDSRNIFALRAVLKAKGYPSISAVSAIDGLNLLFEKPQEFGIILMDMMMPEMDGYEAISRIKKNKDTETIPVLAVTAQAMVGDREKCLAAGATDYISKPINVDTLITALEKFIKK